MEMQLECLSVDSDDVSKDNGGGGSGAGGVSGA